MLASCDTTNGDPAPAPTTSTSPQDPYRDDTSRAEAIEQIDTDGPSGAPVTWRIDDADDPVIETVQNAVVLVELAWARGAEPRPDLVSGLYRFDRTTFTSLFRDRNYVVEGDPDGVLEGPVRVWLHDGEDPGADERLVEACLDLEQATRDGEPAASRAITYRLEQVEDSDDSEQWKIRRSGGVPAVDGSADPAVQDCREWIDDAE